MREASEAMADSAPLGLRERLEIALMTAAALCDTYRICTECPLYGSCRLEEAITGRKSDEG